MTGASLVGLGGAGGTGAMPTGWIATHCPSHAIRIGA